MTYRVQRIQLQCAICNKDIFMTPNRAARANKHYCSNTCRNKGQRSSLKKKCKVCNREFSVRLSEKTRISTCSKECRNNSRSKDKNPNWHGGKEKLKRGILKEDKAWRNAVFSRDNFTCQHCKIRGGNLEAHHINSWSLYPNLRYDVNNGVTLCNKCHKKTFKWEAKVRQGKLIMVFDMDGTICETKKEGQAYADVEPMPGALETLQQVHADGHKIIIYTGRGMLTYNGNLEEINKFVKPVLIEWLKKWKVPYDELIMGKPHYDLAIDDATHHHTDWGTTKKAIEERIKLGPRVRKT